MISTTIFPGRYVQGSDARKRLGQELARFGARGLLVCDPYVHGAMLQEFEPFAREGVQLHVEKFGGECSDEEIARLHALATQTQASFVAGLGGGKTLDTAKAVAYEAKVPVAVVPTAASTDAPCSALSVIYHPDGAFKRYLVLPRNPDLVLVDTRIVARAPARLLVSGMGDALATWFEAESCRVTYSANMTGSVGGMSAYALARLCYETLLGDGVDAKVACEAHLVTPALERIVEANTLLSGLGFESGGLAAAHAIHNGMTVLEPTHGLYHGEKVAFGTLASLFLTDKPRALVREVFDFCESVGLPTTLEGIGLKGVSDDDLIRVGQAACAESETIHHEAVPVSPESVMTALRAADAEGRARMARR